MKKLAHILWQSLTIALLCSAMIVTTACSTDQVLATIDVALQTAGSLSAAIGAVSPADAAALTLLTGLGSRGIEAIKAAYDQYEKDKTASNLQNVVIVAQTFQQNLPQFLSAAHIVDQNAVQKATAWVNLLVTAASDIVATITGASSNAKVRSSVSALNPAALQARWASEVCKGDTACGSLVKVKRAKFLKVF